MGYTTYFQIKTIPHNEEAVEHLKDVSGYGYWDSDSLSAKWYSYEEDTITASKQYPEVLYCVTGEGEERDDNWIFYAKAGEWERCLGTIVYEKSKLGNSNE